MKDNIPYIPHDINAKNDFKIISVLFDYGWKGYGLYWAIIEDMAQVDSYRIKLKDLRALAHTYHLAEEFLKEFVQKLVELKLFHCDSDYFWSESLIRRMKIKHDKIKKLSEAGHKGMMKRWNKEDAQEKPNTPEPKQESAIVKVETRKEKATNDGFIHPLQLLTKSMPNISSLKTQLTYDNCETLENTFGLSDVQKTLMDMENYKPLTKNYNSVYLTALKWLRRDNGNSSKISKYSKPEGIHYKEEW